MQGFFTFNGEYMKKIIIALVFILSPGFVFADEMHVTVKGMVCSFCAQGIKKNFGKHPEVSEVEPDLDKNLVVIKTKEGQSLSDEVIKEVINDAGYEVTNIEKKTQ